MRTRYRAADPSLAGYHNMERQPPHRQRGGICHRRGGAMIEAFDEISFADRYGADVTEAAMGRLCTPARRGASSDELWIEWCALEYGATTATLLNMTRAVGRENR